MAATIPSLWPEIKVDILPPVAILRAQANRLGELTQGILEAEMTTVTGEQDFVAHRLDLIAPALDGRRVRVLIATHRTDFYPVVIEADSNRPKKLATKDVRKAALETFAASTMGIDIRTHLPTREWPPVDDWRPIAANQDEFIKRVGEVLQSREVRSVIDSMIALSNQKAEEPDEDDTGSPDSGEQPATT